MKCKLNPILIYIVALAGCADEGDISYSDYNKLEYVDPKLVFGIHSAWVTSIVEGSDGSIWLGTNVGISKVSDGDVDVVVDDSRVFVTSTLRDSKNNIWFGTADGPLVYDGREWIRSPIFLENQGITINTIIETNNGKIWLGTRCCGVLVIDDMISEEVIQYFDNSCVDCNNVLSLLEDQDGNIWLGSGENLKKFDGSSFVTQSAADGFLNSTGVQALFQDSWGVMWVGTNSGLFTFSDNLFTKFPGPRDLNSSTDILESADGYLYVGTLTDGLWKYNGVNMTEVLIAPDNSPPFWYYVNGLFKDSKDRIWVATDAGAVKMNK